MFGQSINGDDSVALRAAIAFCQTTGSDLILDRAYYVSQDGSNPWCLKIDTAFKIIGITMGAGIIPLPSVGSSVDVILLRGKATNSLSHTKWRDFCVGSTAYGRHAISIDCSVATGNRMGFCNFEDLQVYGGAGNAVYVLNDTDSLGGLYKTSFKGQRSKYWNGLKFVLVGAQIRVQGIYSYGANVGVEATQISGGADFAVEECTIENTDGQIKLDNMTSPVIRNNGLEVYSGAGVGATGAMVAIGTVGAVNGPQFDGNFFFNASTNASLLTSLLLGTNVSKAHVGRNTWDSSNTTQIASGRFIYDSGTLSTIDSQAFQNATILTADRAVTAVGTLLSIVAPQVTTLGDAAATLFPFMRRLRQTAALTAARIITLPAASSFAPGDTIRYEDAVGALTLANSLTFTCAGSDTVNGASSIAIFSPRAEVELVSDGVSKWMVGVTPWAAGGTGDSGTAWTQYTPTITTNTGTVTATGALGWYKRIGKSLFLHIDIPVTANSGSPNNIRATLPGGFTVPRTQGLAYSDSNVAFGGAQANSILGLVLVSPSVAIANITYRASGVIEIA